MDLSKEGKIIVSVLIGFGIGKLLEEITKAWTPLMWLIVIAIGIYLLAK